jgi:glucose uptake protein GlcU
LTGVVITSFFKDFGESKLTIYGIGTAFAIIILIVGLILTNKKDNNKRKEDK